MGNIENYVYDEKLSSVIDCYCFLGLEQQSNAYVRYLMEFFCKHETIDTRNARKKNIGNPNTPYLLSCDEIGFTRKK